MAQRPPRSNFDDDIDDIMASIMRGEPAPQQTPRKPFKQHRQHLRRPKKHATPAPAPVPTPAQAHIPNKQPVRSFEAPAQKPRKAKKQRKARSKKKTITIVTIPVVLALLAGGIYFFREPIASLLRPKPPFSQEIVENMGVPLYYPTKLPGTYKLETDSISQPEKSVVVYAISDDNGKRININQQPQPSDITLDPLYAVLDNVREVETKFGTIKIGVNEGTTNIANILTGETWIILNFPVDTIQDAGLVQIINSLEF